MLLCGLEKIVLGTLEVRGFPEIVKLGYPKGSKVVASFILTPLPCCYWLANNNVIVGHAVERHFPNERRRKVPPINEKKTFYPFLKVFLFIIFQQGVFNRLHFCRIFLCVRVLESDFVAAKVVQWKTFLSNSKWKKIISPFFFSDEADDYFCKITAETFLHYFLSSLWICKWLIFCAKK